MGCTPSEAKNTSSNLAQCPQGHVLKIKKRPDDQIRYCSKCNNNIMDNYMACEMCGYNACKSCAKKAR